MFLKCTEMQVEAAVAECAHQRAQTVSLRDNLKAAHLLTKRVLADGAEQLVRKCMV